MDVIFYIPALSESSYKTFIHLFLNWEDGREFTVIKYRSDSMTEPIVSSIKYSIAFFLNFKDFSPLSSNIFITIFSHLYFFKIF